jgi:hypothetical protein
MNAGIIPPRPPAQDQTPTQFQVDTGTAEAEAAPTLDLPTPGEPDFWNLFGETILVNVVDGVNWATIAGVAVTIVLQKLGIVLPGQTGVMVGGLLVGNVVAQSGLGMTGHGISTRAWTRARAK